MNEGEHDGKMLPVSEIVIHVHKEVLAIVVYLQNATISNFKK